MEQNRPFRSTSIAHQMSCSVLRFNIVPLS
jgi:hypothetical protein